MRARPPDELPRGRPFLCRPRPSAGDPRHLPAVTALEHDPPSASHAAVVRRPPDASAAPAVRRLRWVFRSDAGRLAARLALAPCPSGGGAQSALTQPGANRRGGSVATWQSQEARSYSHDHGDGYPRKQRRYRRAQFTASFARTRDAGSLIRPTAWLQRTI
jgi:hypothetical protein